MRKFFNQAAIAFIFPSLVFSAAALPFKCNISKDGGVYKSKDGGFVWEQKVKISKNETFARVDVLSMAIDKVNPNIIFLGSRGDGIYLSTDEGENWQPLADKNKILDSRAVVYDIKIDEKNPATIYSAVFQNNFGKALRSYDNGNSWQEIYVVSGGGSTVNNVEIDSLNNGIIYLGTSGGDFLKSTDFGLSWQMIKRFSSSVNNIKVDPKNNQIIYAVTGGHGLFKSIDQGQNWQGMAEKMKQFKGTEKISGFLIDPRDSNILYLFLKDAFLKSYDGGQAWQEISTLMSSGSIFISAVAQDEKNADTLYYCAGSVLYKTVNGGQTWATQQIPSSRKVKFIKIDPLSPVIIYVGMHQ
jgi:photosystem II stability/assembly factor-like uncharacterized protein